MMWNWQISSLVDGATVVTFDGFAAFPKLPSPWELVARENFTYVGTTPPTYKPVAGEFDQVCYRLDRFASNARRL
jgi:acyl-coenzyme A synthetase/AMP-(fatty) acid ligase